MMSKLDIAVRESAVPLNSIRVFVEVARAQSFSRAAEILAMTQSGVSHHVKTLERYLGHRLFHRAGTTIRLTDAGRQYFEAVREGLDSVELATRQLLKTPVEQRLIVRTSLPTVAMTVLIPALSGFVAPPAVAVDLLTSLSPPAIGDVFDVLVTRDLSLADETHWLLTQEILICVASPALHQQWSGSGIGQWPFLAARSRPEVLVEWVNALGIEASSIRIRTSFEHYFLAVSAAIGGMGYLVVPHLLVADALRQGHLVDVGYAPIHGAACYSAWVNPRSRQPELARAFCRWLMSVFRDNRSESPSD